MKCDVCLTPIPLGEKRCPNCGYLMRPEGGATFSNNTSSGHISARVDRMPSFDHIQMPTQKTKRKANNDYDQVFNTKRRVKKKNGTNPAIISAIVSFILIFIITIGITLIAVFSASNSDNSLLTSYYEDFSNYMAQSDIGTYADWEMSREGDHIIHAEFGDNQFDYDISFREDNGEIYATFTADSTDLPLSKAPDKKTTQVLDALGSFLMKDVTYGIKSCYSGFNVKNGVIIGEYSNNSDYYSVTLNKNSDNTYHYSYYVNFMNSVY